MYSADQNLEKTFENLEKIENDEDFDFESHAINPESFEKPIPPIKKTSPVYNSLGIPCSRIQNLDSLKEELTCACCLLIVWEPVCCGSCETHFCNLCIIEWLKNSATCPVCQCEFESHPIPRISRNLLSKLQISCLYEENGCKNPLEYKDVYIHQEKCQYRKQKCGNPGCDLDTTLLELKIHSDKCPHLIVACQFCKELLKNRDKENHESECPYRTILCCYEDCGKTLKAMDYDRHLEDCDFKPFNCEYCQKIVIKLHLEAHKMNCDEKPEKCRGCNLDLKLKDLKAHEDICELIEIRCFTCDLAFLRKNQPDHDRLTCLEAGLHLIRKVLLIGIPENNDKKVSFLENNRLELFQKRLEHQAGEIISLKKELLSLQMANLTDSKASVYSLQYPDLPHKSVVITSAAMNPLLRKPSTCNNFIQEKNSKCFNNNGYNNNAPSFQDIKLVSSKTSSLFSPDNISIKKHNYLSLVALNEALVLMGDDLGRLTLWDLFEDRELGSITVLSGVEIKAISLFSYDVAASLEELYSFLPRSDKNSLSLLGFWIITGHASGDLFIWDIDLRNPANIIKKVSQMQITSNSKISSILDLEDQNHFITASYGVNNQIEVWDCLNDMKICSIDKPHKQTISKLVLVEKKSRFISGSDDGTIRVWRIIRSPQSSKILSPNCERTINTNEPIWSLAVVGNKMIVGLNNFSLEIYDLTTKERERKNELDEDNVSGLIGDLLVVEIKKEGNEEEEKEANNVNLSDILIIALHKDRICVYDGELRNLLFVKQSQNEFKWGFLASHLMQILVARRLKEGGNLVKFAVLGQKGKRISMMELTVF